MPAGRARRVAVHPVAHCAVAPCRDLCPQSALPFDDEAAAALAVVESRRLRYRGLHADAGCRQPGVEPLVAAVDALAAAAGRLARALGVDADLLDIGGVFGTHDVGGFGVRHTRGGAVSPPLGGLGRLLAARLEASVVRQGIPLPRLLVEPGRALVADACTTLYSVEAGSVLAVTPALAVCASPARAADHLRRLTLVAVDDGEAEVWPRDAT
jgi:hypothetical protein